MPCRQAICQSYYQYTPIRGKWLPGGLHCIISCVLYILYMISYAVGSVNTHGARSASTRYARRTAHGRTASHHHLLLLCIPQVNLLLESIDFICHLNDDEKLN